MIAALTTAIRLRVLVALALLLAVSVGLNLMQWRWAGEAAAEHAAAVEILKNKAVIAGLESALDSSQRLAAAAEAERVAVVEDFRAIALEQQRQTEEYWRRLRKIPPLPLACAPGQARVDAFNYREN